MPLTANQITNFNENGYICPLNGFSASEATCNRQAFDALLARFQRDGHDTYAINGYHASCRSIYDIVLQPAILDAVGSLIDGPFLAWGTHFFCKTARDPKAVSWHQDAPYWPLTPQATITAWIAIDDVDVANSAMRVIPQSHVLGEIPKRQSTPDENNVLWTSIDLPPTLPQPVAFEMKAGQFSLHHDMLVHGSLSNQSDRRRCGLTVRYAPVSMRGKDQDWTGNAILCRGQDDAGHWTYQSRPAADEPRHGHRIIGGN